MRRLVPLLFLLIGSTFAFADQSSTNYQIQSDALVAGGEYSITSTNYRADESAIDSSDRTDLSSTNYAVKAKTGFEGTRNVSSISTSPNDLARFYTDENAAYTITAQDPDSDTLQYQAKQDGTTKAGPQASGSVSWALSTSDLGRRTHTLEVIDPDGTVTKNQAAYVFRRPVK